MTFPDNEMKKLGRSTQINIHNTESLIRALKYVSDILQREEAFTVEEHKHTYTYTHTHTQTQTLKALGDMNHLDNRRTLLYSGTQHSGTWYTLFNRLQGVPFTGISSMFTKFPDYCH